MSSRKTVIGFDRRLEIRWLDTVATWAGANLSKDELNERYEELFANIDIGKDAKRKTKLVLTTIWLRQSEELSSFNAAARKLIQTQESEQLRLAIHWGKTMATYPFFSYVVSQLGRLFKLQSDVTLAETRRRVVEKYGDTERVKRSVRHVVQSLNSWGIITLETQRSGRYSFSKSSSVNDPGIVAWLVEACLRSSGNPSGLLTGIIKNPAFFSFHLKTLSVGEIKRHNDRLDIIQHGSNEEIVMLRK